MDVKNTSNEAVTLTHLVDDVYGDLSVNAGNNAISNSTCTDNTVTAAGATYSCSFDGRGQRQRRQHAHRHGQGHRRGR